MWSGMTTKGDISSRHRHLRGKLLITVLNLKTAVDFNAEAQRCRVTQRKSEVLWENGKCENFSDGVNLHQLGVACMVLQK